MSLYHKFNDGTYDSGHVVNGRPDLADLMFGVTHAKKFPPYVFSVRGPAALVHKIASVELRWYRVCNHGHALMKLNRPTMIAKLVCGGSRFLIGEATRTCHIPKPDAVLCGRCHGELASFGKNGPAIKAGITREVAKVKLGCVVNGY
jgi:hypothetical protein